MSGNWINDKKSGMFKELIGDTLIEGEYVNNEKHGTFEIKKDGNVTEEKWNNGKKTN